MKETERKIYAVPLYLVMLVPLIVYGHLADTGLSGFAWFSEHGKSFDLFLYHKRNVILAVACLILVFGTVMLFRGDFSVSVRKKMLSVFLPFGIYTGLVFFSSVASPYREYAWNGMPEQYESAFVIGGYFLICVYAYMSCCKEIVTAFGIVCCIIGGIGTLQFLGLDPYRMSFLQKIIMPEALKGIAFNITAEVGRSYCSLSNPNYAGMFCVLTIPVLIALAVCSKTRRGRVLYGTACGLMCFSLIGSRSKSGIMVLAICLVFMAVLFRKTIVRSVPMRRVSIRVAMIGTVAVLGLAACVMVYRWGEFWNYDDHPDTATNRIVTGDERVEMVYRGRQLFFDVDYSAASLIEALHVTDENGQAYEVFEEDEALHFTEKKLSKFTAALAQYGDYIALEIWDGNFYWYFTNQTEDHTWYYLTCYGKPDKLNSDTIPVCKWFEGKERIVSGRGYIWSRTLPIMKKTVLLGSGQDCFTVVFPNQDYLGKARWGYKDMLITKPHCMYLQIAIQSGVVSLIALIFFWGRFVIGAFTGKKSGTEDALLKTIAVGVTGYLLMGITNDSSVGVAPIFWMLVGAGLRMMNEEQE